MIIKDRIQNPSFLNLPMKERKFAKTRIRILESFLLELERNSFENIKIKDLAIQSEVSEPTFYNYFPEKEDLILYFIQIWSLQVSVFSLSIKGKTNSRGFYLLQSLFRYTAKETKKNPRILLEIIAIQARKKKKLSIPKLTPGEKYLLFPKVLEINDLPSNGVDGLILNALSIAIQEEELPKHTNLSNLGLAIGSLFFGVPILAFQMKENLESIWLNSLNLLWLGAGGKTR